MSFADKICPKFLRFTHCIEKGKPHFVIGLSVLLVSSADIYKERHCSTSASTSSNDEAVFFMVFMHEISAFHLESRIKESLVSLTHFFIEHVFKYSIIIILYEHL